MQKNHIWWGLYDGYQKVKAPAKKLINDSNNARKNAQNSLAKVEREYGKLVRRHRNYSWANK